MSFSTEGRADSTWQVDAYGVRNFGSTMPECKHSVAAFALYAFVALVRMVLEGENPVLVPVAALQDDASVWPGSALYETGCFIYNNFLKYFKKYFEIC